MPLRPRMESMDTPTPLQGLKVVELGTLIAGPYCARLLAEFGAEVIKVETPGEGDPLRKWRKLHDGNSLWWYAQARNKKSVAVNLKAPEGQQIVRELVAKADIVVENFRPGTLEKWNLGYEALAKDNPGLIMVRLSGFGQTGPYKDQPGFGAIGESMGGMRYITGYPDRAPVRVGISIGDSLAAMFGVIGALTALHHRGTSGKGQVVDVALYEAVFAMMESMLPEYGYDASVRERTGASLPGIVPSNTYKCGDGKFVVIGANADSIFKRMMKSIGRADLADDPTLADNAGRVKRTEELDRAIGEWTATVTLEEALAVLAKAEVPSGRIYSIADIAADLHFQARGMIERHKLGDRDLLLPGVVPKLSATPGRTQWIGPKLGEHTDAVLRSLGYPDEKITKLREGGII
ncbi:Succinyl-CoA--L-malate CoA-transferase beta subunit [Usitatibacter palustris]|uniref:Succinyl-CoA--L-malate CoA-transferase beta subunit n=2 Tax=Usitatibacter palustris TaxID=2732487 RepID=A0A6M4HAV4_9PROT|nr:Succinyl-CoA--L-malate CoA-transferase beta subunit [Usitatibacter palustris]